MIGNALVTKVTSVPEIMVTSIAYFVISGNLGYISNRETRRDEKEIASVRTP